MASAELPSASSGPAGLMERQTSGTRSWQGTLAQAQTNTVALVSVHVLKCLAGGGGVHFFSPPHLFFSLHANTCADRKKPTDETACVISTLHISKVVCCVITPCLPPARETHRLSLAHCARLLHISPGGEQHRSKYHITEAESCSSRFTDLSFPLLFHQPGRALREWDWKIVCSIHLFRFRSLLL